MIITYVRLRKSDLVARRARHMPRRQELVVSLRLTGKNIDPS